MPKNIKSSSRAPQVVTVVVAVLFLIVLGIWGGLFKDADNKTEKGIVDLDDPNLEIRILTGIITEVHANSIVIDVPSILGTEVSPESTLRVREVLVSEDTVIALSQEKGAEQYAEELAAYQEKKAQGEPAFPPSPRSELTITLSELEVGDFVKVTGKNGENIKNQSTLEASEIIKK